MRLALALLLACPALSGCAREPATEAQVPGPSSPEPSPDHSRFIAAVDALLTEGMKRGGIAGLSVAVFRRGAPVLARGYGHADLDAGRPAGPETSYPIASVSKLFTAGAILRLAEQGKLGLDDPLHAFFPAARPAIGRLTLRQLMSHTSGLTRGGPAPRSAAESVLRRGGTAMPAGRRWDYSNYNFSLLGLVIETISGRSYADYVREEFAAPLGLANTGYCEDGAAVPGRGVDYEGGPYGPQPTAYWSSPRFFAAGGLCASVLDLVRWQEALDEGRVVGAAGVQSMRTPTRLADGHEADYGYGTRLGWTAGRRKVGHTGGGRSNKAVLARYPDDDVTIAVLLNTERSGAEVAATALEHEIGRLFFGAPETSSGVALTPRDLARYTGQYRDGVRAMRVVSEGGALKLRVGPGRRGLSPLIAQGGDVFVDGEEPSLHLRFQMEGDRARAYARYNNGWFVGAGVRTGDLPPPGSSSAPARRRPARRSTNP
ncbi:MAG TPA: serine hydrolase domain-containing protein [Vicinamibacteria bacterium]|nr:serine hydrolase domain-containing protein [Vicinamibacteria bacterium]